MLLVQKAALSVKHLCVLRNLRAMPSFWRRATEAGPALAAIGSTFIVAFQVPGDKNTLPGVVIHEHSFIKSNLQGIPGQKRAGFRQCRRSEAGRVL
jgi:hypothetical protein